MDRNQLAFSRDIRNGYKVMKMPKQFSLVATFALLLGSCQSGIVTTGGWQPTGGAGENIEVKADLYDQIFQYRYGLLYQAMATAPVTGRIVIVDSTEGSAYVSNE